MYGYHLLHVQRMKSGTCRALEYGETELLNWEQLTRQPTEAQIGYWTNTSQGNLVRRTSRLVNV